jgi:hypothetical protein
MSSLSTNYKFFKPGPQDLVDPVQDMKNNLMIADTKIFGLTQYRYSTDNVPDFSQMENGWKVIDQKTGRIKYLYNDPSTGPSLKNIPRLNNTNPWNPITFSAGWDNNEPLFPMNYCAWRYYITGSTDKVELKGRFTSATIANNTSITIAPAGSVPSPVSHRYFGNIPGIGGTNTENNSSARIQITNTGSIVLVHYGTSNSGAAENYATLDNIIYSTL